MMRLLASFIMRGRVQAITVVTLATVLSVFLPPLLWVAGAGVGLVTLRLGAQQGAVVGAAAALATAVLFALLLGTPVAALAALPVLVPGWLLAVILRHTVSLPYAVVGAGAIGLALVLGIHATLADPRAWWRGMLDEIVKPALEQSGAFAAPGELDGLLDSWAGVMTGAFAASMVLGLVLALLLARWWQALLYNPGGFRQEFHALRLGRGPAFAGLAVLSAALLAQAPVAVDLAVVVLAMFAIQGLAVLHGLAGLMNLHRGWLIALYVLMVFAPPQVLALAALLGLLDNGFDFRAAVRKSR